MTRSDPAEAFTRFIADQRGLTELLLGEHVPDSGGRHCRVCGGVQSGREVWPCSTRRAAEAAQSIGSEQPT